MNDKSRTNVTRDSCQLGIFAKYWQPGQVKTRLAATIGDQLASELYRSFLDLLLERFRGFADRQVLSFTPEPRRDEFLRLAGAPWTVTPQGQGDLGQRMQRYFMDGINAGCKRIVLIGSDSPTLPKEIVSRAFHLLDEFPVVLGPSTDGGYYLVGARDEVPPIFEGIPWSTPGVWHETARQLNHVNLDFAALPRWYDVDQISDLHKLHRELHETRNDPAIVHSRIWSQLFQLVQQATDLGGVRD